MLNFFVIYHITTSLICEDIDWYMGEVLRHTIRIISY